MDTQPENPEDIDRLLNEARKALQDFEDGADRKRLLLRLRTASPAHPVLLSRFLFGGLSILALIAAVAVMVMTMMNHDLARTLARFEQVIPFPEEIPALPALMVTLSVMMGLAWGAATLAAIQLGRDATMLPWEQKQHQKLVNEVTRLTTQKAVMERIRSTPAGARPRIATPVPVSARTRANNVGLTSRSAPSAPPSNESPPPTYAAAAPPSGGRSFGGFGNAPSEGGRYGNPPSDSRFGNQPSDSRFGNQPGGGPSGDRFGSSPSESRFGGANVGSQPQGGNPYAPQPGSQPAQLGSQHAGAEGRFGNPASGSGQRNAMPSDAPAGGFGAAPGGFGGGGGYAPASSKPSGEPPAGARGRSGGLLARASGAGSAAPGASGAGGFAPVSAPAAYTAPTAPAGYAAIPGGARSTVEDDVSDGAGVLEEEPTDDQAPPPVEPRAGGVRLGASAARPEPVAPRKVDDFSDLVEVSVDATPPREPTPAPTNDHEPPPPPEPAGGGILGRARAGATGLRSTPYGAAGRIRPPPVATAKPAQAAPAPQVAPAVAVEATRKPIPRPEPVSTRGGTPLGAAPRGGVSVRTRASTPPGSPDRLPGGMFGTPPPVPRTSVPPVAEERVDEVVVMEEEEDVPTVQTARPTPDTAPARRAAASAPPVRPMPHFGPIDEEWLTDALTRAEALLAGFPVQAYLEFSQEPHLPFTLVIARATPAMAVRAMVNFVEFLAGIATPPRARIELVNIPHLDRSFHKNVEAALEPYFGGNVEVEPNPGRVDILFTDPDPQWGNWPVLPLEQSPES